MNNIPVVDSFDKLLALGNSNRDQVVYSIKENTLYHLRDYTRRGSKDGWRSVLGGNGGRSTIVGSGGSVVIDDTKYVKYQSAAYSPLQTVYGDFHIKGNIYADNDIIAYYEDGTAGPQPLQLPPIATHGLEFLRVNATETGVEWVPSTGVPDVTGNGGKWLHTDGSIAYWDTLDTYTTSQINTLISSSINTALADYYTKTQSDDRYYTKTVSDGRYLGISEATKFVKYQDAVIKPDQTVYGNIIIKGHIFAEGDIAAYFNGTYTPQLGNPWNIPIATTSSIGGVKPDNSTIFIDINGIISAAPAGVSSWNDLNDKPSWLAYSTLTQFEAGHGHAWTQITGKPTFATVATSGSYNDLSSKPDLSVYQLISTAWNTSNLIPFKVDFYINNAEQANSQNNNTIFSYSEAGTLYSGPLVSFSGSGAYSPYTLQLNASYLSTNHLAFRQRNGDNSVWGNWKEIYHTGNLNRSDTDFTAKHLVLNGEGSDIKLNSTGYVAFIGTSSERLILGNWNNATNRLTIDMQNGGVGIGTTPETGYNLTVNGNINAVGSGAALYFQNRSSSNKYAWYAQSDIVRLYNNNVGDILTINNIGDITANKYKLANWTIEQDSNGLRLLYNGNLRGRLTNAGKIQVTDDVEAYSSFS